MNLKIYSIPLLLSLLLIACDGAPEKVDKSIDSEPAASAEANAEVDPMADFKFHRMIAELPSPMETFHILSASEVELSPVDLTTTAMADQLNTMSDKAFGYGIYVTDMGFLAYEQSNQEVLNYMQVCRQLAGDLGAGEVFDRTIAKKYKENETSQEQFVAVMEEGFKAIDDYMQTNERFLNATEIFVGSWVESQIIATHMLKDHPLDEKNRSIYEGIYAQKRHASNLMNVLGEVDGQIASDVHVAVEELMMFYAGFSKPESISQEDLAELQEKLNTLKLSLLSA